MNSKEKPFYRENHTKKVRYDLVWIDPVFADWLDTVYTNRKTALDQWSSVLSLEPADGTARSLPTGGRVFVYNLKKPFIDPVSQLPCFQIDVKGVGLTKSGYLQDRDFLEPNWRQELMWHPRREEYFGYENLARQKRVVRDLRAARSRGHSAPIPLAVLNLRQMVFDGQVQSISRLRKSLEIDWAEDFSLLIRGYPVTATRVCDLTRWDGCLTPDFIPADETLESLNWARAMWTKYELPRLLEAAGGSFDHDPTKSYFRWFHSKAIHELATIFTSGYSPSTSYENPNGGAHHTHLQNHTTANSHVEWTPLSHISKINRQNGQDIQHMQEIIVAEHDALVNIGAVCLAPDDLHLIPSYNAFLGSVSNFLRGQDSYLTPTTLKLFRKLSIPPAYKRGDKLRHFLKNFRDQIDSEISHDGYRASGEPRG